VTYVPITQQPSGYAPVQPAPPSGYIRRARPAPQPAPQDVEVNVPPGF
jgi:hypothetical protein